MTAGSRVVAAALLAGLLGAAGWLATTTVWTVDQTHEGVVLRFGRVARRVPPGIHLTLPWPIERMERLPTSEVERMTVGYRLGTDLPPDDDEVQWLTGDTNIAELKALVTFRRADPVGYLFGTADLLRPAAGDDDREEGATEPKERILRKVTESVLTDLLARMPIDDVLSTGKAAIQREARPRVQALLDELRAGIEVSGIEVVEANPPRDVISAFQDVASAKADRERRVTEATGERARTMPRARAEADRLLRAAETYRTETLNRARGTAEGFRRLEQEIARNPEVGRVRLWLDTVRRVLPWVDLKVLTPSRGEGRTLLYLEE